MQVSKEEKITDALKSVMLDLFGYQPNMDFAQQAAFYYSLVNVMIMAQAHHVTEIKFTLEGIRFDAAKAIKAINDIEATNVFVRINHSPFELAI